MRIGVVSDTHLPKRAKKLPDALLEGLQGVDMILHCGDWSDMAAYETLARLAPVDGVAGNTDPPSVIRRFGRRKLLDVGGVQIGIVHGHEGRERTTAGRAMEAFRGERVDLVLFGHSHIPLLERRGDIVLFNPGSPTDKRRQPRYSYGMVAFEEGNAMEARHIFFD